MSEDLRRFLDEDVGAGDVTTALTVPPGEARATVFCEEDAVVAGVEEAVGVFGLMGVECEVFIDDGGNANKGDAVMGVRGRMAAILTCERTALNFLMRMSGIATATSLATKLCAPTKVAGTRKTTPGFRKYEKRAIELGGGLAHRHGLYDAVLIKDNHIKAAGGLAAAMDAAMDAPYAMSVQVEAETLVDAVTAAKMGADSILVDNLPPSRIAEIRDAVKAIDPDITVEASGGVDLDNVASYSGVADVVSMGSLTHSARAVHFSLDLD
ncbi:MAG: carboxylating nicotinate-nucleotide diphosphorylase [Thermoplasmatales archaeon]|mgnify:CR=1 FL=1|nr:carboxylating nicotinate-nucleotide diphosphorylase [Thermoplasmatales archaeon]